MAVLRLGAAVCVGLSGSRGERALELCLGDRGASGEGLKPETGLMPKETARTRRV